MIAASRYSLASDVPDVHTFLTQAQIEGLPRLADDSLKAVQRLPGAASNGLSGLANMRGGESNETLIVFDGLPLYDPFHLRLLLSPTSVLDPRVLRGLDVHAGGFTAEFGDRMSTVIEAHSLQPEADAYYELGLSLFHANALASQRFGAGRGQWLAAVRRSNLDEIADLVDSEIGEPSYTDGFARLDYAFSDATRGSLHVLLSSDHVEAQNTAETEFAEASYRNAYWWATLEHDFSPATSARAIVSYTDVASDRSGEADDPGRTAGSSRRRAALRRVRREARREPPQRSLAAPVRAGSPHALGRLRLHQLVAPRTRVPRAAEPGQRGRPRLVAAAVGQPLRGLPDQPRAALPAARRRVRPALG